MINRDALVLNLGLLTLKTKQKSTYFDDISKWNDVTQKSTFWVEFPRLLLKRVQWL